jgi:membrane protease YdiL (CAAX protease family)
MTNEPSIVKEAVDWRRVILFCTFAFLISGSAAIYIAMNGGLESLSGTQAMLVLGAWYMPGPALAHLLTRAVTREGWQNLWLKPRFRQGWREWLVAWILPPLVVMGGAALYFAIFPQHFDATFGMMRSLLEQSLPAGQELPISVEMVILIQIVQSLLIAPLINALPTLGEEFGWRAYLQPKLLPLGWRPAMIWMGLIWGVWHWPILAMGYNYGLEYSGAPWLGMFAFTWFTTTFGIVLGWLTLRGGSVWPAVIGHGALNGIAALPTLVMQGEPNPLLGPMAHGIIAGIPLALIALWMWFNAPAKPVITPSGAPDGDA